MEKKNYFLFIIICVGEECEFLPGDADDSNLCCDFDCKTIDGAYCAAGSVLIIYIYTQQKENIHRILIALFR